MNVGVHILFDHAGIHTLLVQPNSLKSVQRVFERVESGSRREHDVMSTAHDRALTVPVIVYVGVISAMFVVAQATGIGWLAVAATLFLVSDSLLGWNRFVRHVGWMPLAVMVTYHLAQAAFVAAVVA